MNKSNKNKNDCTEVKWDLEKEIWKSHIIRGGKVTCIYWVATLSQESYNPYLP